VGNGVWRLGAGAVGVARASGVFVRACIIRGQYTVLVEALPPISVRLEPALAILAALFAMESASPQASHVPDDTSKTFFVRRDAQWSAVAIVGSAGLSFFDKRIANYAQTAAIQGSASRQ